jgi:hypothetical protein
LVNVQDLAENARCLAEAPAARLSAADFLAGANLDRGDPEMLLFSMTRFFKFLPQEQKQAFLGSLSEKAS